MSNEIWICAAGLGAASLLGSGLGLVVKRIPHRLNDVFLGFCAGMMVAASIVCLIMPAVEESWPGGWWQVLLGLAGGILVVGVLDRVVPHLHQLAGIDPDGHHGERVDGAADKVLLFVMAIAIHKLPEGIATGIVFDGRDLADAYTVAVSIAVQNVPEGLVVVTPMLMVGVGLWRAALAGLAVAAIEVAGVFAGYYLGGVSTLLLPFLLSVAGGAMLYVISDEMIPETHSHGYERGATVALVTGVAAMLFIQQLA